MLDELEVDKDLRCQTQKLIIKKLPTANLNVDLVSEKMNMSRRTLARKLRYEGIATLFVDVLKRKERG